MRTNKSLKESAQNNVDGVLKASYDPDSNIAHYVSNIIEGKNKITATVAQDFTSKNWYAYLHYKGQTFTQWGTSPDEAKENLVAYMEKHELVQIKFNN